jgi:transcription elongation GreA/GreB family factor
VNKSALRAQILSRLGAELAQQTAAAQLARDEAISEESRPENQYDTHSLEAGYLAEGQARLAAEIRASIEYYQALAPADLPPGSPIAIGALVELRVRGRGAWYFLGPRAGGLEIPLDGHTVLVLTPQSPLGRKLLGRHEGDCISVSGAGGTTDHLVAVVR